MLVDLKEQIIKDLSRRLAFMQIKHNYLGKREAEDEIITRALMDELSQYTGSSMVGYSPKLDEVNISSLGLPAISSDLETAIATPMTVLVVPLLGYHHKGYRLGRGGGFYDKLMAARPGVITIGVGYSATESVFVPGAHDKRLHTIITEDKVMRFGGSKCYTCYHS